MIAFFFGGGGLISIIGIKELQGKDPHSIYAVIFILMIGAFGLLLTRSGIKSRKRKKSSTKSDPIVISKNNFIQPFIVNSNFISNSPNKISIPDSSIDNYFELINKNVLSPKPSKSSIITAYCVCGLLTIVLMMIAFSDILSNLRNSYFKWFQYIIAGIGSLILYGVYSTITKNHLVVQPTFLEYSLPSILQENYRNLQVHFSKMAESSYIGFVQQIERLDKKYYKSNAGAEVSFTEQKASLICKEAIGIVTNISIPVIVIAPDQRLMFFPDKFVSFDKIYKNSYNYDQIKLYVNKQNVIEKNDIPEDCEIAGYNWKYQNNSGEPDKRFNDNIKIPVLRYEALHIELPNDLYFVFYFSKNGFCQNFVNSVGAMTETIVNLKNPPIKLQTNATSANNIEEEVVDETPNEIDKVLSSDKISQKTHVSLIRNNIEQEEPENAALKDKLIKLKTLYREKLITKKQYETQSQQLTSSYITPKEDPKEAEKTENNSEEVATRKIKIYQKMTVHQLKNIFRKIFGTGIRIYTGNSFADSDEFLQDIGFLHSVDVKLNLPLHVKIGMIEKAFQKKIGIKIQIENKNGDLADNNLTLAEIASPRI
jgi:hypothetical protein